tara:strand:- start:76 stop:390 length:315 start_codon:yes stop_codon:yes gene_type:complete
MDDKAVIEGPVGINGFKKVGSQQPDWTGKIPMTKELLKEFVTYIKESPNEEVQVGIAQWERVSKAGNKYLYTKIECYVPKPKQDIEEDFNTNLGEEDEGIEPPF